MSETKLVYVVLRRSGKPMTFKSGLSMYPDASTEMAYLSLLSAIASDIDGAGGDYDEPYALMLNGEIVDKNIMTKALAYRKDMVAATDAARDKVRNMHAAPFDKRGAPGYNPPGIDLWTVTKKGAR
jgi:hypothetical protein